MPNEYYLIENGLYQGGMPDEFMPREITAVLSLMHSNDVRHLLHPHVEMYAWLPILDGPFPGLPWLEAAVKMIEAMREAGQVVYIHCRAGISRSTMVTAAYLMKKNGWDRDTALEWIATANRHVDPNPHFLKGLREYDDKLKGRVRE